MLAELDREEKSGFNLNSKRDEEDSDKDFGLSDKEQDAKGAVSGGISKEDPSIGDNYDDDFSDDIQEDLPEAD